MKLSLSFLILLLAFNAEAQLKKFETAVDYNDFIVAEQTKIGKVIQEFNNTFANTTDSNVIHKVRIAIIKQADSSIIQVKRMSAFKGDTALKNTSISLFKFYAGAAANEYAKLIRIFFNKNLSTDEMSKQIDVILKSITGTEKVVDKNYGDAQKAFAEKHGIKLTENEFKINE